MHVAHCVIGRCLNVLEITKVSIHLTLRRRAANKLFKHARANSRTMQEQRLRRLTSAFCLQPLARFLGQKTDKTPCRRLRWPVFSLSGGGTGLAPQWELQLLGQKKTPGVRRTRSKARHSNLLEQVMTSSETSEAAKAVVRRNTQEVQGGGNFEVFEELFADDFLDHTPQPGRTPDKDGARQLYKILRTAFPDFHADIHWQLADGDRVTTYKTYHGTHRGEFLGVAPTGRKIQFETVDVMRVRGGKITEHWGVANLFSLMQQLGAWPPRE